VRLFHLLKTTYEKVIHGFPIDYRIVEDMYDNQYKEENKALAALQVGTWMVTLISSIGIFSLSVYMSVRRVKEFGIRRVLGAISRQITLLHVGSFMKIALFANVIALPIAYWLMKEWLAGFAYRINFGSVMFIVIAAILFLLVISSTGYSSLRAGKMNPVDVIKTQ
jgi:putative ABC transport system permease protein